MTAQIPDYIPYKGEFRALYCNPLEAYFQQHSPRPEFPACSSACWRGYVATWKVNDNRLYLHALRSEQHERRVHDVDGPIMWATNDVSQDILDVLVVFQDAEGDVLADWVTGELRIPDGEMLQYAHGGYGSVFERDIMLDVENGIVAGERIVAPPDDLVTELKARNEKNRIEKEKNRVEHELYMKRKRIRDESVERLHKCLLEHISPVWQYPDAAWEMPVVCDLKGLIHIADRSNLEEFIAEIFRDGGDDLDTLIDCEKPLEPLLDLFVDLWDLTDEEWREKWPELYKEHSSYFDDGSGIDFEYEEAEDDVKRVICSFFLECRRVIEACDISLAPEP